MVTMICCHINVTLLPPVSMVEIIEMVWSVCVCWLTGGPFCAISKCKRA